MPIRSTKNARPIAREFELSKTATPSDSKIRKSPDPELHTLVLPAFACVDKIPIFRGELLKECRYWLTFCQVTALGAGTASYPEPNPPNAIGHHVQLHEMREARVPDDSAIRDESARRVRGLRNGLHHGFHWGQASSDRGGRSHSTPDLGLEDRALGKALSPIGERNILSLLWSNVLSQRSNQPVVRILLEDMRNPSGNSVTSKDRRHQVSGDPQGTKCNGNVQFDVGSQALLLPYCTLNSLRNVKPFSTFRTKCQLIGDLFQNQGTGVKCLVDSMTESHDTPTGSKFVINELLHFYN